MAKNDVPGLQSVASTAVILFAPAAADLPTWIDMRIVMMALLMIATTPAWADWVKVSETYADWDYYDPATIRKVGTVRRVWQMQDLKSRSAEGALSRRFLGEYDCKEDRWRILSFTFHAGPIAMGEILANHSTEPSKWFDVAPGTVAEQILRLVCIR